jgi:hypothetical protein
MTKKAPLLTPSMTVQIELWARLGAPAQTALDDALAQDARPATKRDSQRTTSSSVSSARCDSNEQRPA